MRDLIRAGVYCRFIVRLFRAAMGTVLSFVSMTVDSVAAISGKEARFISFQAMLRRQDQVRVLPPMPLERASAPCSVSQTTAGKLPFQREPKKKPGPGTARAPSSLNSVELSTEISGRSKRRQCSSPGQHGIMNEAAACKHLVGIVDSAAPEFQTSARRATDFSATPGVAIRPANTSLAKLPIAVGTFAGPEMAIVDAERIPMPTPSRSDAQLEKLRVLAQACRRAEGRNCWIEKATREVGRPRWAVLRAPSRPEPSAREPIRPSKFVRPAICASRQDDALPVSTSGDTVHLPVG